MIIVLTGGSGCGKSTYAERLITALGGERRVYIATMQVYDEESVHRVARHRAQRAGKGFETLECPKDIARAPVAQGSTVLLEDLPNLVANEMFDGGDWTRVSQHLRAVARRSAHMVVVTNDIFSDGVTYAPSTQEYIRRLAQINNQAAAMADYVAEVVYSIPVTIKGEAPCVW